LQKYDQAKTELETTQRLVAADSEDYKKVVAELAEVSNLINVAGAATSTQPTIGQLEGTGGTVATPQQQEPLVNEGEKTQTPPTQPSTQNP